MKRLLIEFAAVLVCAALGVGLGRSYDPKVMSWAVYLGLVFAVGALGLIVLTRIERYFDSGNATDPAGGGAGSSDHGAGRDQHTA